MPTQFGPNIIGRTGDVVEKVVKAQPKAVVVLNDRGLQDELCDAAPKTMVIYRDTHLSDDRQLRVTPDHQIEVAMNLDNGRPNQWFYTTNESGVGLDNINWHVSLLNKAPKNLRWVGLNPGIGTYPDSAIGWSYAESALRVFSDNRDRFIFGLHEYAGAVPNSGMPNFTNRIQNWDGPTMPAYHCGRFWYLDQFCKSKNFQTPRLILTEHGFDHLNDIEFWTNTLHVHPGFPNVRGWRTLVDQWTEWYRSKEWSPEKAYFEALKWLRKNVYANSPVEAMIFYCWGNNGDLQWLQFNMAEATEFVELWLADAGVNVFPLPKPLPNPEPAAPPAATVNARYRIDVPSTFVNVRDAAAIPSNIISKIVEGDIVTMLAEKKSETDYWRRVRLSNGIEGWISLQWSSSAQKFGVQFFLVEDVWLKAVSNGKDVVNVRKQPTSSSPRLGAIAPGQVFDTSGEETISANEGYWLQVRLPDGQKGWSSLKYLDFNLK